MLYKLKTPNHLYSGVTEGVPFSQGVGHTDDKNVRNVLVNDYGYKDITVYDDVDDAAEETGVSTKKSGDDVSESLYELANFSVKELKEQAKELELTKYSELTKPELIELITNARNANA